MGEVYLAERENEFRRRVAIKLIRPGMASLEVTRRFLIERQTLAALNHPQIVRLIDGGTTEDNLPYLVVDYVDGRPIDAYADGHSLNISQRLKLFIEVCGAVHHAHQNLIVHCDLKPSNILVTEDGVPMLLDFGIAKLLDPGSLGVSTIVARTRQRAFTPDYASPEQLRGEPVTTATDVYALGVILYELLSGHSPYRTTASGALADWIKSVCEEDAEPPSTAIRRETVVETEEPEAPRKITPAEVSRSREGDPQRLERRLRGDLDAIVLKALRKDPRDRYGSVDQMAEDIRRHLDGRPVLARKHTGLYVARKFFSRHKIGVAAAAMVLLAVAAGIATTMWEARIAARRFDYVRQLAHTFLFDVYDSVQNLPGSTQVRGLIARTGTDYLDRLAGDAAGDPGLQLELAEGYLKLGNVEGNPYNPSKGDSAKALENYRKALPLAQAAWLSRPHDPRSEQTLARVHVAFADTLPFQGKAADALDHVKQAEKLFGDIAAAAPASAEAKLDLSGAWDAEGDIQGGARTFSLGHDELATAAYEKALALIPDLAPSDPFYLRGTRGRAVELAHLGDMEIRAHRIEPGLADYDQSLHTAEALARTHPNDTRVEDVLAVVLNKIASEKTQIGDNKGAIESYRRALAMDESILAADPNNEKARSGILAVSKNMGDLNYYNLNNIPEALANYRKAEQMLEAQSREDPGNVVWQQQLAEVKTCVASALLDSGHPADARREAVSGLEMAKSVADRSGASVEQIYNYAYLGINIQPSDLVNAAAVLPYALKAVAMSHEKDPFSLHVLAQTYAAMNNYSTAIATEEKASALFPPIVPGQPVSNAQAVVQHFLEECRKKLKQP